MAAKRATTSGKLVKVKVQPAPDQASQARAAMELAQDHSGAVREANARITGAQSARVNDFMRITDALLSGRGVVLMITGETAVAVCGALRRGGLLRDGSRVTG